MSVAEPGGRGRAAARPGGIQTPRAGSRPVVQQRMVAFEGREPVGFCWGETPREHTGVRPAGASRASPRGHGRHLLTSLRPEARILGPRWSPRCPPARGGVRRLLRCGWKLDSPSPIGASCNPGEHRERVREALAPVTYDDSPPPVSSWPTLLAADLPALAKQTSTSPAWRSLAGSHRSLALWDETGPCGRREPLPAPSDGLASRWCWTRSAPPSAWRGQPRRAGRGPPRRAGLRARRRAPPVHQPGSGRIISL